VIVLVSKKLRDDPRKSEFFQSAWNENPRERGVMPNDKSRSLCSWKCRKNSTFDPRKVRGEFSKFSLNQISKNGLFSSKPVPTFREAQIDPKWQFLSLGA